MSSTPPVLTRRRGGVARLVLARPEARNALDERVIEALSDALAALSGDDQARVLVLEAEGEAFCAGTDLAWMELAARGRGADDLYRLGSLLHAVRACPKPVIARVQGAAIGAGAALVACADVAACARGALFQLPALRLGHVPAVIGPYLIEAMGLRQARRYLLTGEAFGAEEAVRLGLVHVACDEGALDAEVERLAGHLLKGGPHALREAKRLLATRGHEPPSPSLLREAATRSAEVRRAPEGREGLAAALERREPRWTR